MIEIYQTETREYKSYIVFIFKVLVMEEIFYLDSRVEEAERLFFKYYLNSGKNLRMICPILLKHSQDIDDMITLLHCFEELGPSLITQEYTIEIIEILENKCAWIKKTAGEDFFTIHFEFFFTIYDHAKMILEVLAEDGDLSFAREEQYFIARRKLLLFLLYLHHLGIGDSEEIKENFHLIFQNLSSKNLKLNNSRAFFLILNLNSQTTRFLEMFHIIVLRVHAKVCNI